VKFFLEQIKPYFVAKKDQAELMIKFCESRIDNPRAPYTQEEIEIYNRIRELNRRGIVAMMK